MQAREFFRAVGNDRTNFIERLLHLMEANGIRYCVIGGIAVSAYAEPVVSLDFDIIVANYQLGRFESLLASTFLVKRTPRIIEITASGSDMRVNVFTETRYVDLVERATTKNVLGMSLPVALVDDVLRGKVWLSQDNARKKSKRLNDLADIARLIETNPRLRGHVPEQILRQIEAVGV
jgi:hypothetical protein